MSYREFSSRSMFSDRRVRQDRRKQNLPMPSGLDRRKGSRRQRQFQAQPWWLQTNYAAELVSESTVIESGFFDKVEKPATPKSKEGKPSPRKGD